MLFSIALMIICSLVLSGIMQILKLPGLIGMLLTGIILGPYMLNLLSPDLLNISADLREIALIIILLRVGMALDYNDLKKVGWRVIFLCFIPSTFEIIATTIFAPIFFSISYLEAAIMGTVIAAVSPAILIPKMLKIMENGYGKLKSIPQLIMASGSVENIYVIILFTSLMTTYGEGTSIFKVATFIQIPIAILVGLLVGILFGIIMVKLFKFIHMRDTVKVLIILCVSFLIITLEAFINEYIPMSGFLAVMALGGTILKQYMVLANRLSSKFSKIWVVAELMLFILVGAMVDITYISSVGLAALVLIFIVLLIRVFGVLTSLIKAKLNIKEKLFCAIAYVPKATIQAVIGGLPLAAGVPAGNTILTMAVLTILITAPLGALGIDVCYTKLLEKDK